jgi:hypothetical protein
MYTVLLHIGRNATNTTFREHVARIGKHEQLLLNIIDYHGFHGIHLKLSGLGGQGDHQGVSNNLDGCLVDGLGDDRIDFARHDGASRLHGWQIDIPKDTSGATRQQP